MVSNYNLEHTICFLWNGSITNAPATFQRMINGVIVGLEGCDAYVRDVVV